MSIQQDPVSDYLTRLRNASKAGSEYVDIPLSKIKENITKILKNEGYIKHYKAIKDDKQGVLRIYLKYRDDNEAVLTQLERISKPNRRVYIHAEDIKKVRGGMGVSIVSTSAGLMTGREAWQKKIGGELLLRSW